MEETCKLQLAKGIKSIDNLQSKSDNKIAHRRRNLMPSLNNEEGPEYFLLDPRLHK
jgi:hypothetical protein